jgi:hypothetical protein
VKLAFIIALRRMEVAVIEEQDADVDRAFDGANYPASFVDALSRLVEQRRLQVVWTSDVLALVRRPT